MNILYTINGGFVPQVAAAITSICENNKIVDEIHFYIMSLQIPEKLEQKLEEYVKTYDKPGATRDVTYIELGDMQNHFDFEIDTTAWNPIVLARLLLDELLPEDLHRIIYMDGDTIVRGNLTELWNTDMGDSSVGACMEPTCSLKRKAEMGLKNLPYHNAGVLLVDLDNWRKNETGKEIIDYYRANDGKLYANDQDAINGSLKNRIKTLSMTYNYHNTYDIYRYRLLKKNCDYPIPSKEEVKKVIDNPCIIHFLGEERPWRKGNKHRFGKEYIEYLDMTPWKGQNIEEGWGTYFMCWNIFNFVMKPFPVTRCHIINSLVPMILKHKS